MSKIILDFIFLIFDIVKTVLTEMNFDVSFFEFIFIFLKISIEIDDWINKYFLINVDFNSISIVLMKFLISIKDGGGFPSKIGPIWKS